MRVGEEGRAEVGLSYEDFGDARPVVRVCGWPPSHAAQDGR